MEQKNLVREENLSYAKQLSELTFTILAKCQEKEDRLARQYSLTHAEFKCLKIFNPGEELNNKELAERLELSASRLTRITDGLVFKGFAKREIDRNDRRNMIITLTDSGKRLVEELNDSYIEIHKQILEEIDSSQHESLIVALRHLLKGLLNWMSKT